MRKTRKVLLTCAALAVLSTFAFAILNYFEGFETDTGDWVASQGITRVASGAGTLHLTAGGGSYYAEIQNQHDGYQTGYGDAGYSFYGGKDSTYRGGFYQAIDVYLDPNWTPPAGYDNTGFWIDMTPYHADANNFGAEHNFHVHALGGSLGITVDGQTDTMATITASGWYTFLMTWQKGATDSDPVVTDMKVYDHNQTQVGTTVQVNANSPGGPFLGSDLRGNGYVWITLWQNGFANDVMGIDNLRTGLLPFPSVYSCSGFQAPMDSTIALKSKTQRAIPLKAQIFRGSVPITPGNISMGIAPVVNINFSAGGSPGIDETNQLVAVGQSSAGNTFSFDPSSGTWFFNLSSQTFTSPGTYRVTMLPGDPSYTFSPQCSGMFVRQP